MRTPIEIFNEMSVGTQTASRWIQIIESAQKEAWNEAVEAAAKVGYKRLYDIGEYEELVEAAILKLKR